MSEKFKSPEIIKLKTHGDLSLGYLTVAEKLQMPINRVYWSHQIPGGAVRGNHAHKECVQILFALQGSIKIETLTPDGREMTFELSDPSDGLVLWPHVWHSMTYGPQVVQLVLASMTFDSNDYLRTKIEFENHYKV